MYVGFCMCWYPVAILCYCVRHADQMFLSRRTFVRARGPKTIIKSLNPWILSYYAGFNTLRPRQNGRHFSDDIFKRIFFNENIRILIKISLKFVPRGPINNIPAMVQIMAWHRPSDKPLSEPMMVRLPTHICVSRPRWFDSQSCPHYGDVIMGIDSVSNHQPHDCFIQPFIQTQIKEYIKALRHWPLCWEFTDDRWIPRTHGQ